MSLLITIVQLFCRVTVPLSGVTLSCRKTGYSVTNPKITLLTIASPRVTPPLKTRKASPSTITYASKIQASSGISRPPAAGSLGALQKHALMGCSRVQRRPSGHGTPMGY